MTAPFDLFTCRGRPWWSSAWRVARVGAWLVWPMAPSPAAAADPPSARQSVPCAEALDEGGVLTLLNALRAGSASCGTAGEFAQAPPLRWDAVLADGAGRLARRLAADHAMSHAPDGRNLDDRLREVEYRYQRAAENIAAGPGTLDTAVAGWMRSAGHCANVMTAPLRDVGVACAVAVGDGTPYWTMVLGTRASADDAPARPDIR